MLKKILSKVYNHTVLSFIKAQRLKRIPEKLEHLYYVRKEPEIKEIINYFKTNQSFFLLPYKFTMEYFNLPIEVSHDSITDFKYVEVNNNRVFFPSRFSDAHVLNNTRISLMEQDNKSPHRYRHLPDEPLVGQYAVLIGASDCLFALSIVDNFERLFLFEADEKWHGPMKKTMEKHLDKVVIVPELVGQRSSSFSVSLDDYFRGSLKNISFIQADIEGDEMQMLMGSEDLVCQAENLKLSVCVYHRTYHEQEIGDFLRARGYSIATSDGYVLTSDTLLQYPYLRKGIIYATKKSDV